MDLEPFELSLAGAGMVEDARKSVVQVGSGRRGSGAAGVIWPASGLVMTNHHVVAGVAKRGRKTRVVLHDGRAFGAEVVKRGRSLDLALLRLEGDPGALPAASIGDSDALRAGELVYAIGHPWGSLGSVTSGIVSGLGVAGHPGGRVRYIQSDVALAPGNSGGPLLNARGEVVGINAMISGSTALSVPSNAASLWAAGERRHRLGVALRPVGLGRGETGLIVVAIEEASPAHRAGLLVGDVLLGVADEPLDVADSLLQALARSGDAARLRVMRGGSISFVNVPLGATGHAA